MPSDIYDQHRAAFANVSAYVVARDGQRVATIAFKYPRDGAGRLWAYVHWLGTEMVRGYAGGYGYDKRSAACCAAIITRHRGASGRAALMAGDATPYNLFARALFANDGHEWHNNLRRAGFDVWQAV
jgi:hypothetical protein